MSAVAAANDQTGGETILVVDDDPRLRTLAVRQMRELGYKVIEAEDGPTGLMILNSEKVDLLFTDVVMPGGMSGYEMARLVLSRWPRMKALITSGYPEARPDDGTISARLRFLPKPYRKPALENTLREVLDTH